MRTSQTSANGLKPPACPPVPAHTRDQAVDAGLERLLGMAHADDVVKHLAAPGVRSLPLLFKGTDFSETDIASVMPK